jgi:AmmeMemoRadiSam system protein B
MKHRPVLRAPNEVVTPFESLDVHRAQALGERERAERRHGRNVTDSAARRSSSIRPGSNQRYCATVSVAIMSRQAHTTPSYGHATRLSAEPPAVLTRKRRVLADTVGFAHLQRQIEAVVQRIAAQDGSKVERILEDHSVAAGDCWRMAIAPHDDYAYAGFMYPLVLRNVAAPVVIIFGVAHRARQLGLEDQLVFDSFTHWPGPYGDIAVSSLRERIMIALPEGSYRVSDQMHSIEHSVEAKLPFLQHYNRAVEFVPILVPSMSLARMNELASQLARAIALIMDEERLEWGADIALVSSTDAVHYGDEGWGGKNFSLYGADAEGYAKALAHERQIMRDCFDGDLRPDKIERFTRYTLADHDHREYKWPWCGRYSVPFGLLTAWYLQQLRGARPLVGTVLGYATSLGDQGIKVDDLDGMGVTAAATLRHWVGYAAVGFR